MKLLFADVRRDGGSITLDFRLDDGRLEAIHLKVAGPGGHYCDLLVSDQIGQPHEGRTVAAGSAEEIALFERLDRWLASPAFSDEWYPQDTESERHERRTAHARWVPILRKAAPGRRPSTAGLDQGDLSRLHFGAKE